ncbi:hypothetical protein [Polyangium aurulentum]|uniref:hypothetical protein n=1 Tax=Polyangium aurulentum TaxID=2567896 RepID=UPI0010AED693|nr:hypothetical protein [Polyangium aurulentum]UQA59845.1 hypothetical protein E8A73_004920 [Polyangium aurulentum]
MRKAIAFCAIVTLGFAAGCGAADAGVDDENVDSAELAQLDYTGGYDWRSHTGYYTNGRPFGRILVIGRNAIGGYNADTEYWYVDKSNLQYLGSYNLEFSYTNGTGTPPSYSGTQEFALPAIATWQSFSSDPVSGGALYDNGSVHLRLSGNSTNGIAEVTWYQTIPSANTPANLALSGVFYTGSGSVSVPSGQTGYVVDQTP